MGMQDRLPGDASMFWLICVPFHERNRTVLACCLQLTPYVSSSNSFLDCCCSAQLRLEPGFAHRREATNNANTERFLSSIAGSANVWLHKGLLLDEMRKHRVSELVRDSP